MANSGLVSCGLDGWQAACPNGLTLTLSSYPNPRKYPPGSRAARCAVPDLYTLYSGTGDGPTPTLLWDADNQVATSDTGPPYFALFCNDGAWWGKWIYADGSTADVQLGNPNMDYPNSVYQLDDIGNWTDGCDCVTRYTFRCA